MRSSVRSLPPGVQRWATRVRWLRWLDALAAWLVVWWLLALLPAKMTPVTPAVAAPMLVGLAALASPVRRRWGPIRALVALSVSRALRPGDRAWLVLPTHIEPVIVTARRRLRLVVARPDQGSTEGLEVRRTRVLVVPPTG
ncbi:MAG: hypothetical protein DMD99_05905 [Candidatus Rokuibacteriota bacterium]|nr:MAG: hypothetical protein DMD99_05905 [Candidatus Rokubacteria bacterium]